MSSAAVERSPNMDFSTPPTAPYPSDPRLPLLTLDEARNAVRLLRRFADGSPEGRAAGEWAADIGLRLPSDED